jgi:hypothetical protein
MPAKKKGSGSKGSEPKKFSLWQMFSGNYRDPGHLDIAARVLMMEWHTFKINYVLGFQNWRSKRKIDRLDREFWRHTDEYEKAVWAEKCSSEEISDARLSRPAAERIKRPRRRFIS